jgi:hypothetical protein
MHIELCCPSCSARFVAPPEAPADEVQSRFFEEGPAYALGDGETFEDMIFTTLTEHGNIQCPECGDAVAVSEESLGRLALAMLDEL